MAIYLYIKQHKITGLLYFGKTVADPYQYMGSGKYWSAHLKKYGRQYVDTLKVWEFDDIELCESFAINFSATNDIVNSENWANLIIENGRTGGALFANHKHSSESKNKIRDKMLDYNLNNPRKGKPRSEETRRKISESKRGSTSPFKGRKHSSETKMRISNSKKSSPFM